MPALLPTRPPRLLYAALRLVSVALLWTAGGVLPTHAQAPTAGAAELGAAADSIAYAPISAHQGGDCVPGVGPSRPCRVRRPWSEADLRARWAAEGRPAWADGDTLTFVYEAETTAVEACCTLQMPMSRLAGTGLWVLSARVPGLETATVEYGFLAEGSRRLDAMGTLRGPAAAPRPARSRVLQGTLRTDSLWSDALGERRAVTVYLPPGYNPSAARGTPTVYVADGQGVTTLAGYAEPLILAGEIPPTILVGLHSGPHRSEEYTSIPERSREADPMNPRFLAHERFVLEEVLPWAEREFGAASAPERRAAFGFSNGGVWAAFQGVRRPDVFGTALSFSCGACSVAVPERPAPASSGPVARFYFLAGRLEPSFLRSTRAASERLRAAGYEATMHERVAGHDSVMWNEQFGDAVRWAFGPLVTD